MIGGTGVDARQPICYRRVTTCEKPTSLCRLERKAHHDVGRGKIGASESFAAANFLLYEVQMGIEHRTYTLQCEPPKNGTLDARRLAKRIGLSEPSA